MKRGASALVLVGLIGPMVFAADATPPYSPEISKLHGDLAEVLRLAAPDELVPVKAIMTEQVPRERIQEIIDTIKVRDLRYRITKDLLKPLAEQAQVDLLAMLRTEQATGSVGPRIRTLWISNIVAADVTPDVAYRMAARDDVALLAHNPKVRVFPEPGEIQDEPIQEPASGQEIECGVEVMGAPRVWDELGFTGRGAVVAMIDTGACPTHPDIVNQIWSNPGEIAGNGIDDDDNGFIDDTWGWNFDANNNNPTDSNSHGSHTAGTVGGDGTGGTATGVAPDVSLMILKVGVSFSDEVDVWNAMQYAADNRAHTFSMSLGWPHSRNPVRRTWREISINGIAMGTAGVVAAGNEGSCCPPFDHTRTPGDVPEIITVGATDCSDRIAGFSSRGPVTWQDIDPWNDWPYPPGKLKPTVSAPGVNTVSLSFCSGYSTKSGTSMACPHVAGLYALMAEANPNILPEDAKAVLIETALDLGEEGWDNTFGAGRADAFAAVQGVSGIRFLYPDGLPEMFSPTEDTVVRVEVLGVNVEPQSGTGRMHYSTDGENYTDLAMAEISDNVYDAVFPSFDCFEQVRFFFSALDVEDVEYRDPGAGPQGPYSRDTFTAIITPFADDFEQDQGWSVVNENLDDGAWERGTPFGSGDAAPDADFDGSGQCYVTGNRLFQDVDGGPTRLVSPIIDMSNADGTVSYARYFVGGSSDRLTIEVSNDGGATWVLVSEMESEPSGWEEATIVLSDFVAPSAEVVLRFSVADNPNNSFTEAAIDAIEIVAVVCEEGGCVRKPAWQCDGDVDGDAQVNPVDAGLVQAAFGSSDDQDLCNYDLDCDGQINPVDSGIVQSLFGTCDSPREVCP